MTGRLCECTWRLMRIAALLVLGAVPRFGKTAMWGLPDTVGAHQAYLCLDSTGEILDTLRIVTVGGSAASDSISTSIWELRYTRPSVRPFPTDTDSLFAGRDGSRLVLQGQNQCCPFVEVSWPLVAGSGMRPRDTTRVDSIWIQGTEDIVTAVRQSRSCAKVGLREKEAGQYAVTTLWIDPRYGIMRIERALAGSQAMVRVWLRIE